MSNLEHDIEDWPRLPRVSTEKYCLLSDQVLELSLPVEKKTNDGMLRIVHRIKKMMSYFNVLKYSSMPRPTSFSSGPYEFSQQQNQPKFPSAPHMGNGFL